MNSFEGKRVKVLPDIVVHNPSEFSPEANLLAVEVKKSQIELDAEWTTGDSTIFVFLFTISMQFFWNFLSRVLLEMV